MKQLVQKDVFSLYSQISLVDAEDVDSYPQWDTGEEKAVFGPKGVVIAVLGDARVDVTIYEGDGIPEGVFYASGEIEVGKKGLIVGNEVAADTVHITWRSGKSKITIYVDNPAAVKKVSFVLE